MSEGYPVPESDPPTAKAVYARGYAKVRVPLKFKSYAHPAAEPSTQQVARLPSPIANSGLANGTFHLKQDL